MDTIIFASPVRIGITSSINQHRRLTIVSAMTPSEVLKTEAKSSCTITSKTISDVLKTEARSSLSITSKTVYKDNWFDLFAIDYLSKAIQDTVGLRIEETGYESLVMAARAVFMGFTPIQQRELVTKSIQSAIPSPFSHLVKNVLPPSKFSREYFATFTAIFFRWLVGPCEVKESEFEGRKERNVVHIKKCRFLEASNCAGMCTNLCKIPTQKFIKESFGVPLNMVPNFDDMSCEMIYGVEPPALKDDPVLKQPCYKLCDVKHKHDTSCLT